MLGKAMGENYVMLATSTVVIILGAVTVISMVRSAMERVRTYHTYMSRDDLTRLSHRDDETYPEEDDHAFAEAEKGRGSYASNFAAISAKLGNIKRMYSGYNKEMSKYTRNKLNREPDDLMDERILNRESDDYEY